MIRGQTDTGSSAPDDWYSSHDYGHREFEYVEIIN
jgi:hypothetical protein